VSKVLPFRGVETASEPSLDAHELLQTRTGEVEELFAAARAGSLPRARELKPWEPHTLNEEHLQMILLRVGGIRQNKIARHFGVDQSRLSVILNHPDAQYILDKLGAVHAVDTLASHRERIAALRGPALDLIEDFVFSEDIAIEKRVPRAFDLLRLDEEVRPKAPAGPALNVNVTIPGERFSGMLAALRESSQIEDANYVVLADEALVRPGLVPGDGIAQPGPAKMLPEGDAGGPPHQQFPGTPAPPAAG
jgi:hypothetical protein